MKLWFSIISLLLTVTLSASTIAYADEIIEKSEENIINELENNIDLNNVTSKSTMNEENVYTIPTDENFNEEIIEDLLIESIEAISINKNFDADENLKKLGSISIKHALLIDGKENTLFATFDNPQEAMNNVKEELQEYLDTLSNKYSLSELNEDNWLDYKDAAMQQLNESDEISSDISLFTSFIDIYENDNDNNQIIDIASNYQSNTRLKNQDITELISVLPYTNSIVEKFHEKKYDKPTTYKFNRSEAVAYAEEYAESPNPFYQYFLNGDCTNFVSQILENAGVAQTAYWWHETNGSIHNNSKNWSVANEFAGYWGVEYIL